MKIALIKIHNILGIKDLEFEPGGFNEITGGNNVNKTNLLNAIKSVVEGGHDATLLHAGAEKGEVVLLLDDGLELKKTVTSKASRTEVRKAGVKEPLSRPMDIIGTLADLFSVNPIAFLTAPKADRAKVLLESMPIELDQEKLAKLAGVTLPQFHANVHPLTIIETARLTVYDHRTGVNRILEEKRGTIEQLRKAMPDAPGVTVEGNEEELEAKLREIEGQYVTDIGAVTAKLDNWVATKDEKLAAMTADFNAAIDTVRAQIVELNERIAQMTIAHQEAIGNVQMQTSSVRERAATKKGEIGVANVSAKQPIVDSLQAIRSNRTAIAKREQTEETIRAMTQAADLLKAESEENTEALKAIDAYKMELLSKLPIPGIEVVNGEVFRGGIPFDRLNAAQRTDIAIELAKMRAGKLGFVGIDGLELMDEDAYQEFQKKAVESGLQFFVTRVGRGDLKINSK